MTGEYFMKTASNLELSSASEEIEALIDQWITAVRDKNIDAIMAYYAPEIVSYDAILQLQFKGIEAYRKHWAYCLELCAGPMLFEPRDRVIHANKDLAFAHWLCSCGAADEKGQEKSSWMRASAGYRRINGRWQAVHEHFSAPFDMESGKALFDLQP
jgi:ketosteroid isomerase-like protein